MKVRLEIIRNQLPSVKILWHVDKNHKVSDLLDSLNPVIPLEAETWGLEDYIVETEDDYELLHYQVLADVLDDNDRIRIRPLRRYDARVRTLSGRLQISANGRHIIDGVPFGQPLIRAPNRPDVYIPAADELDSTEGSDEMLAIEAPDALAGVADGLDSSDRDSSDDAYEGVEHAQLGNPEPMAPRRSRRLAGSPDTQKSNSDTRAREGGSSDPLGNDIPRNVVSDPSRGTKRKADTLIRASQTKRVRWEDERVNSVNAKSVEATDTGSNVSDSDSDLSSISSSSSDDDVGDYAVSTPRISGKMISKASNVSPVHTNQRLVPPGRGLIRTRKRNDRRKLSKKLSVMVAKGLLAPGSDKSDLEQYIVSSDHSLEKYDRREPQRRSSPKEDPAVLRSSESSARSHEAKMIGPEASKSIESIVEDISSDDEEASSDMESSSDYVSSSDGDDDSESSSDESETSQSSTSATQAASKQSFTVDAIPNSNLITTLHDKEVESKTGEFRRRREALLKQIGEGGVDIESPLVPKTPNKAVTNGALAKEHSEPSSATASLEIEPPSSKRRKLDVKASQRMLLGSLGHRAPRSEAERAKLSEKLSAPAPKPAPKSGTNGTKKDQDSKDGTAVDMPSDPDYWKDYVDLVAVECCGPDVPLSTPPFPFKQRWDPSQKGGKKGMLQDMEQLEEDCYEDENDNDDYNAEQYFSNGDADENFYGEQGDGGDVDGGAHEDWSGIQDSPLKLEDDLPALPDDPTSLPGLKPNAVSIRNIICYQMLEVTSATSWTPTLSPWRTAEVLEAAEEGKTLKVRLARRDIAQKQYDEEGNRVFDKFETGEEETDGAEGELELRFEDLADARLVVESHRSRDASIEL